MLNWLSFPPAKRSRPCSRWVVGHDSYRSVILCRSLCADLCLQRPCSRPANHACLQAVSLRIIFEILNCRNEILINFTTLVLTRISRRRKKLLSVWIWVSLIFPYLLDTWNYPTSRRGRQGFWSVNQTLNSSLGCRGSDWLGIYSILTLYTPI